MAECHCFQHVVYDENRMLSCNFQCTNCVVLSSVSQVHEQCGWLSGIGYGVAIASRFIHKIFQQNLNLNSQWVHTQIEIDFRLFFDLFVSAACATRHT